MTDELAQEKAQYIDQIADMLQSAGFLRGIIQTKNQTTQNWRTVVTYSDKVADALVLKTRAFIRIMFSDVETIKNFANWVSVYLTEYFIKSSQNGKTKDEIAISLQDKFFNNFDYIKTLEAKKSIPKSKRTAQNRETRALASRHRRDIVVGTTKDGAVYKTRKNQDGVNIVIPFKGDGSYGTDLIKSLRNMSKSNGK